MLFVVVISNNVKLGSKDFFFVDILTLKSQWYNYGSYCMAFVNQMHLKG